MSPEIPTTRSARLTFRHCLVVWLIAGLGFVVPVSQRLGDPDIWWHLKTGEFILTNRIVPSTDPFSWTCHGKPWLAHEWLSEVVFYTIFSRFGLIGIILTKAALVTALVSAIYVLVRRKLSNQAAALGVTALCALAGWELWGPRPQLFTYLLLTLLLILLDRPLDRRILWLAVPMFWLWSNLHGAWIFGFAVFAIFLADAGIAALRAGKGAEVRRLALVLVCSLLAVLGGPSPLERLVYPFQYLTGVIPSEYVTEFQSPSFRELTLLPYEVLLLGLPVILYLGRRPMRAAQWIVLPVAAHFSLLAVRHTPLFGIVSAPIIALQLQAFLDRRSVREGQSAFSVERRESLALNMLLLVMLPVLLAVRLPRVNDQARCVSTNLFPVGAVRFLSEHPRIGDGKLLNSYNWGGYLIFHLYPKYLVSMDGRADVHRKHMVRDLKTLEHLSPSWRQRLNQLDPDVILWPADKPLAIILRNDPEWRTLYRDKKAAVFARKRPSL